VASDIVYGIEVEIYDKFTQPAVKLGQTIDDVDQKVKKLAKSVKDTDKGQESVSGLTKMFQGLTKMGIVPVIDVVKLLTIAIDGLKKIVAGSLGIAAQFEQWQVSFEVMTGSAERARDVIKELTDFAAKTPFEVRGIMSSAKQLLAVGFAADELKPTLGMLGDVAAGLSVPIERLILNLGQVKTQTYLTGRELRDFNIAGVPLTAALAQNLGKSEAEIKKMVAAGKIGFGDVIKAFDTMTKDGGRFYDMMKRQNKTFLGQWAELKDNILLIGGVIGEGLIYMLMPVLQFLNKLTGKARVFLQDFKQLYTSIEPGIATRTKKYQKEGLSPDAAKEKAYTDLSDDELIIAGDFGSASDKKVSGYINKEMQKRGGRDALIKKREEAQAKKDKEALDKMINSLNATGNTGGAATPMDRIEEQTAGMRPGLSRILMEQDLIEQALKNNEAKVEGAELTEKQISDLKTRYAKLGLDVQKAISDETLALMKEELIEVKDDEVKKYAIYKKYADDAMVLEEDKADLRLKMREIEIAREKQFQKIFSDIARDSLSTYADMVEGKLDLDRAAAKQREDIELDFARGKEDLEEELARSASSTLEERRAAQKKYNDGLLDLEKRKSRAIEDNDKKQREAQEENANAMKNLYKKMAIDFLLMEAAKSAAWFTGEMAKAASNKATWPMIPVIAGQAALSAVGFASGISAIQGLETGGVVAGEGIYRMGEKNKKEAVIPLERDSSKELIRDALGGGGQEITVYNQMVIEGDTFDLLTRKITNNQAKLTKQGRL
jgi:tape measure domain-containing protein